MSFYTYKITNLKNGKIYIGKAVDIEKRWSSHKTAATRKDPNDFAILHRSMLKHGFDNFKIEQLTEHIAKEYGCSQTTILKYIRKHGIVLTKYHGPKRKELEDGTEEDVVADYKIILNIAKLSDKYGVSKDTIRKILAKHNIKPKPSGRPKKSTPPQTSNE